MVYPQIVDGADSLQICKYKVAVNILNRQLTEVILHLRVLTGD
jgi:hypothetical protein